MNTIPQRPTSRGLFLRIRTRDLAMQPQESLAVFPPN